MNLYPLPDPGQIVEVRQRQWVVLEVGKSAMPANPLQSDWAPQHFLSLSSIEDDALGEELQVVWELEPGTRIRERASLPSPTDGFDDPVRLDTFLDAVRWGAVSSANTRTLQSPFHGGNRGSNPLGDATRIKHLCDNPNRLSRFCLECGAPSPPWSPVRRGPTPS